MSGDRGFGRVSSLLTRRTFVKSAASAVVLGLGGSALAAASAQGIKKSRLVVNGLDASAVDEGFVQLMRTGGASCRHITSGDFDEYAQHYGFVAAHSKDLVIAGSVREIREAHNQGKISFIFGAQSAGGYSSNAIDKVLWSYPLGNMDLIGQALQQHRAMGLRTQGICYNSYNAFGSGCLNKTAGISRAGRRLVEEIHKHRIVLDVGGHTGERTSLDAIEMSSGVPIVCTHTNLTSLNDNIRCISDPLAEAIAGTGGVIGLTAISDFHVRNSESAKKHGPRSPRATLELHLDQYDYLKRLVGVDHVALGPDFVWNRGDKFDLTPEVSDLFPPDSTSAGLLQTIDGFANISELPNLIKGLSNRGWTEDELDKVLGENWLRVYERVWGE